MKKNIKRILFFMIAVVTFFTFYDKVYANKCDKSYFKTEMGVNVDTKDFKKFCDKWEFDDGTRCVYSESTNNCIEVINPTSSSPSCPDITVVSTCEARLDCYPVDGVCYDAGDDAVKAIASSAKTKSAIIKKQENFNCAEFKNLTHLWLFIRISSPFIVILFGSFDYFKAVMASDEKKMKEARGKFNKRLIAFLLLIVLPFMVQLIFENIGTHGSQNTCILKCILTNNTSSKGCDD